MCGGREDTVDHVIPAAYGGENTHAGLKAACANCNREKSDKHGR